MTNKHFLSTAVLAVALAGCASEDPAVNNNEDGSGEARYLSVNIVTPAGPRATGDGFEDGTDAENKADKAVFLFYDEYGNSTQSPQEVDLTTSWPTPTQSSTNPQVEKISSATVVIAGTKKPTQMIAILNPQDNYYDAVNGYRATTIRQLRNRYDAHEPGKFIMTNSVYVETKAKDGTDLTPQTYYEVFTTDIKDKAQKTIEAAKQEANQVNVYVERAISKVRTNQLPSGFAKGATVADPNVDIDGIPTEIIQEIDGIEIANMAKTTFLLKDITGWRDWDWTTAAGGQKYDWNDAANKRCYWTTTPGSLQFDNLSWNDISNEKKSDGSTNHNFRDPNTASQTFYVMPNTHPSVNTAVLLTATIKDKATGQPLDFVRWGGTYYRVGNNPRNDDGTPNQNYDGFLTQYAVMLYGHGYRVEYYENDVQKYRPISGNELSWITNADHEELVNRADASRFEAYETTAKLEMKNIKGIDDPRTKIVKLASDGVSYETADVNQVNNALCLKENRVWMWKGGKCYYYVDIEHYGPNKNPAREEQKVVTTDFSKGIVRNHIYDLNLQSLSGLGTPVFNPDEVIIPQKPSDDLWYIASKLNILKWRVVNQNVNFNDTEKY